MTQNRQEVEGKNPKFVSRESRRYIPTPCLLPDNDKKFLESVEYWPNREPVSGHQLSAGEKSRPPCYVEQRHSGQWGYSRIVGAKTIQAFAWTLE